MINLYKIFYINLLKRIDRKQHIEQEFKKSALLQNKAERFNAVDGTKLNFKDLNILSKQSISNIINDKYIWNLSITPGALGLILTYLSIFETLQEQSFDSIAIFEDDVVLINNFDQLLVEILTDLPTDFDLCYLGYCDTLYTKIFVTENLFIPKGQFCCTPGMIISYTGIDKLKHILTNDIEHQLDSILYQNFYRLNVYASTKRIIHTLHELGTDIQYHKFQEEQLINHQ